MKRLLVKLLLGKQENAMYHMKIRGKEYAIQIQTRSELHRLAQPEQEKEEEKPKPIRQIIGGKLYDTEKAEEIIEFDIQPEKCLFSGEYPAILYVTQNGNFFYRQFGSLYILTREKAAEILEGFPDEYRKFIGEPEEA